MEKLKYKVCTNCVMDSSDSKIEFDQAGVCDHCRTYYSEILPIWNHGNRPKEELLNIIGSIKKTEQRKGF